MTELLRNYEVYVSAAAHRCHTNEGTWQLADTRSSNADKDIGNKKIKNLEKMTKIHNSRNS
jgi:hypothetical protein